MLADFEGYPEDYKNGYLDALSDVLDELSHEEGDERTRLIKELMRQIISEN